MKFQCFHAIKFSAAAPVVDRENGMIRGVAIISIGAAKGHGVLIDGTTLLQVKECAGSYASGMPVKFNADTFDHGPAGVDGHIPTDSLSLDKENGVLRGDFKVLKSSPRAEYIYDLAETQPDTFGLSLEFDGEPEEVDGMNFARCTELYGVTLVDQPAANHTGLFRAVDEPGKQKKNKAMTDEEMKQFKAAMGEIVAPLAQTVAEMKTGYSELTSKVNSLAEKKQDDADDEDPDDCEMSAEQLAAEKMAAGVSDSDTKLSSNRKVNRYRRSKGKTATIGDIETIFNRGVTSLLRTAGGRAVSSSAARGGDEGGKTRFELRVETLIANGMTKQGAWALAVRTSKDNGNDFKEFSEKRGVKPNKSFTMAR